MPEAWVKQACWAYFKPNRAYPSFRTWLNSQELAKSLALVLYGVIYGPSAERRINPAITVRH